ncbi:hypothetical protein MSKU9_2925 [Komagataeibacter diospyri]|uniref:Uncharacterized protein n=1 Tax=Komagataeibacter diospyri TaxID=1932662 RepID=A0A4P5NWV1_9PROT|nr:hypothetical protein MSKU9_2925 [Komagataeibacter diospyri]
MPEGDACSTVSCRHGDIKNVFYSQGKWFSAIMFCNVLWRHAPTVSLAAAMDVDGNATMAGWIWINPCYGSCSGRKFRAQVFNELERHTSRPATAR